MRDAAETTNLRDQYNADLVALLSRSTDVCGVGYMAPPEGDPTNGYSATSINCAIADLAFAHELGHNMGSAHNQEAQLRGAFPYSHGHYVRPGFRTVMAYCGLGGPGCVAIPYFSNLVSFWNGHPMGVENARDNARSLNNMSDVIANYRYSGSSITMSGYNGGEIFPRLLSRTITWTSAGLPGGNVRIELSRDESTTWQTLVDSTPNDGAITVSINVPPTKGARLRITSVESPTVSDSSVRNISIR